jgi:5-methylcytosine-specific restriction endonuclease McrA
MDEVILGGADTESPELKICTKCGESKPLGAFAIHSTSTGILRAQCRLCRSASVAAHHAANKARINARRAADRAANPGKHSERNKKFYYENHERELLKRAEWRADNLPELRAAAAAWRAKYPERQKAAEVAWRAANPEVARIVTANRRARIKANGGVVSKGIVTRLLAMQGGKCACCGKELGEDFHLDHIMPLALGGANEDRNLQLLRAKCNLRKGHKHPVDYMQERGFLL